MFKKKLIEVSNRTKIKENLLESKIKNKMFFFYL